MPKTEESDDHAVKFYEDERKRWPVLSDAYISEASAKKYLKKLCRKFGLEQPKLEFKGKTISYGGRDLIRLAKVRSWLVFIHEFCHVWEEQTFGVTGHRRRLRDAVDTVCQYVSERGWHLEDLRSDDDWFHEEAGHAE